MKKILVEISVGELLDKISILEIKSEKIKDPEKLNFINYEYNITWRYCRASRQKSCNRSIARFNKKKNYILL